MSIDAEVDSRRRVIGSFVAYATFILAYGLIIARFGLSGFLLGWLPAAMGAVAAGYVFYRSRLLCLMVEVIVAALSFAIWT